MASIKKCKYDLETTCIKNFVSFSEIGGLADHIRILKELIFFPLLYSSIYDKFKVRPPRGVLFYGPPGTGKTLIAGALAKECSKEINGKVSFFSRKGADILDKWVGESEEKLRTLFSEAAQKQPSIIFFDEIDGLAPIRSSRQDQVHASVVATLLALMDGLDKLQGVVVIGATNRVDAIDPALRRPGRFDRELYFPLPTYKARLEILEVHTKSWSVQPTKIFLAYLADMTTGYCGSDLQALCAEAVMSCLRRIYPEIHKSKVSIKARNLKVEESDFLNARASILPSSKREVSPMRRLTVMMQPLLQGQLDRILFLMQCKVPHFIDSNFKYQIGSQRYAGKLLITGNANQGHNTHLMPSILHALEHLPSYVLDIQALFKSSCKSAEETCVQKLTEAKQNLPSIILAYRLDEWWDVIEESARAVIVSSLEDLHASLPLLILATSSECLPLTLQKFFNKHSTIVYQMENPNEEERTQFLYPIFMQNAYNKCRVELDYDTKPSHSISASNSHGDQSFQPKATNPLVNITQFSRSSINPTNNEPDVANLKLRRHSGTSRCKSATEKHKHHEVRKSSEKEKYDKYDRHKVQKTHGNHIHKKSKDRKMKFDINSRVSCEKTVTTPEKSLVTIYLNPHYRLESVSEQLVALEENIRKSVDSRETSNTKSAIDMELQGTNQEKLNYLFRRAIFVTTLNMPVATLELLHEMLNTCVNRSNQNAETMLFSISRILLDFETKGSDMDDDQSK